MRARLASLAIFITFVFVLIVAPYINGYFFQKSYLDLLNALNAEHPFQLHVIDYKRGWFSADTKAEFVFTPSPTLKLDANKVSLLSNILKKLVITQHINYGPFVKNPLDNTWHFSRAWINTTVHLSKSDEYFLLGSKARNGIMQIQTNVSFGNLYQTHFQIPAISLANGNKAKLSWAGVTGTADAQISNNFITQLTSDVTFGGSQFQVASSNFSSLENTLNVNMHCPTPYSLCTSDNKFSLPSIISNLPDTAFTVTNFMIHVNNYFTHNNNYTSDLEMTLNKFESPYFTLNPLSLKISAKDLNAEVLTQLKNLYDEAKNSIVKGSDYKSEYFVFLAKVNLALPKMITPTSSLSEDIQMKTSYGNIISNGKLYWPTNTPLPKSSADLAKASMEFHLSVGTALVNAWITKMDEYDAKSQLKPAPLSDLLMNKMVSAKNLSPKSPISTPVNLNGKNQRQLDALVARGFITHENDTYSIAVIYENKVLKINGITIPLKAPPPRDNE